MGSTPTVPNPDAVKNALDKGSKRLNPVPLAKPGESRIDPVPLAKIDENRFKRMTPMRPIYSALRSDAASRGEAENMRDEEMPKYHRGGVVRKTGPARLLKGERVLNRKQAARRGGGR